MTSPGLDYEHQASRCAYVHEPEDFYGTAAWAELVAKTGELRKQGLLDEARLFELVSMANPPFAGHQDEVQRAYRIAVESGLKPIHIANVLAFLWNRRNALHCRRREHNQKESKP